MERLYKFRAVFKCMTEYDFTLSGDQLVFKIYETLKKDLKINIGLHVKITCMGREISSDKDYKISDLKYFINDDVDGDQGVNELEVNFQFIGNMDEYLEGENLMFDYEDESELKEIQADKTVPDKDEMISAKMKCASLVKKDLEKGSIKIPLLVSINVNDLVAKPTTCLDLVCIIDRSGSMSGNISLVTESITELLDSLNDKDRVSLVEFDDKADRLCPLTSTDVSNREMFKEVLDKIQANGGTSIGEGLKHGLEVLAQRKVSNSVTSVLLLTDGQDGKFTEEQYSKIIGKMDLIMDRRGLDTNYIINTFGMGAFIDSSALTTMCNRKQGNFYFISDSGKIKESFKDCLDTLKNTICKTLTLEIVPETGIQITKLNSVDGIYSCDSSGKYTITLTNVPYNRQLNFLCEVEVPKQSASSLSKIIKSGLPIAKCNGEMKGLLDYGSPTINFSSSCKAEIIDKTENLDNEIVIHQKRIEFCNLTKSVITLCSNKKETEAVTEINSYTSKLDTLIKSPSFSHDTKNKSYLENLHKEATKASECAERFDEEGSHYLREMYFTQIKEKNSSAMDIVFNKDRRFGKKVEIVLKKKVPEKKVEINYKK